MEIYFEDFVFWNFSLDLMLLCLTGRLMRIKISRVRIIFAAAFGTLYALCIFSPQLIVLHSALGRIFVSCILIAICFRTFSAADFAKKFIVFYLVSFLLGGTAFAVESFLPALSDSGALTPLLGASALLTIGLSYFLNVFMRRELLRKSQIFSASISAGDKCVRINCLCDTGNSLQSPFSAKPVIVTELSAVSALFPQSTVECLTDESTELSEKLRMLGKDFCLLTYRAVGTDCSFLIGFKNAAVTFEKSVADTESSGVKKSEAVLALYTSKLSADGSFSALANLQFFEENFYEKSFYRKTCLHNSTP